jgi:hypothetical protein
MSDPNYVFDFSAFPGAAAMGQGGMSFISGGVGMGAPGAGGGPTGGIGAMSGGGQAGGGAPAAGPAAGGAGQSGGDLASLLGQSPFGPLLNLPGVTAQNLFSNVNPNDYSGGNPFAALGANAMSGAYGGNPFAGIGTNYGSVYATAGAGNVAAGTGMPGGA